MRRFLLAVVVVGASGGAQAADLPFLRGTFPEGLTQRTVNWEGFYVGAQGGYGSNDQDFAGANNGQIRRLLSGNVIEPGMGVSSWPLLGSVSQNSEGYGGFFGYNSQWDDVVIGIEGSYMHGRFGGTSSGGATNAAILGNFRHTVTSNSSASMQVHDFGSVRARAGYVIGSFLPYVFGGISLGAADITQTSTVDDNPVYVGPPPPVGTPTPSLPRSTPTVTDVQRNQFLYGYSAGFGIDVNLTGGLFLRAEYEYLAFTNRSDTQLNIVRAGLGYKF
jgi:opacity protein-like surface antigen